MAELLSLHKPEAPPDIWLPSVSGHPVKEPMRERRARDRRRGLPYNAPVQGTNFPGHNDGTAVLHRI